MMRHTRIRYEFPPQAGTQQSLPREVTSEINWYMRQHGIRRSELAERMGITAGRVSQILSGDENLTLHTLQAVCSALGAQVHIVVSPDDGSTQPHEHNAPAAASTR